MPRAWASDAWAWPSFDELGPPLPPPPGPIPPIVIRGGISRGGGGGSRAVPICPPGTIREWSKTDREWLCEPPKKKRSDVDYAILPLSEADVRALADGEVEVFVDAKGKPVVRLVSDDGTIYYYAELKDAKTGRVKKGDVIGHAASKATAPKELPPPRSHARSEETREPEVKPTPIFGVMPVEPILPHDEPAPETPQTAPRDEVLARRRLSTGEAILIGVGMLGLVLGIAYLLGRKARKRRPRRRARAQGR